MTAAEYQLGRRARSDTPGGRGDLDQDYRTARWRLALAVSWLAALVAWGVISYATAEPEARPQTGASVQADPVLDGRGKWTGYVPY